jgi:hypothetical protein
MLRFVVCVYPLPARRRPDSSLVPAAIAGGRDVRCYAGSTHRSRVGSVAARFADLSKLAEPVPVTGGFATGRVRAVVDRAVPDRVCRPDAAALRAVPVSSGGPATAPDLLVGRRGCGDAVEDPAVDAVPGRAHA